MFNRSFLFVLIVTSAFTLAIGQTPEAKKEKEKAAHAFAFSFDGGGGYLGVQLIEVSNENFAKFGLRDVRGVAVEKVVDNSPAAAAGLRDGDVIVKLDGEAITSSRKLTRLISEIAPDHQVRLTIVRGGNEQDVTATIGKRPTPEFENGNFTFTTPMGKLDLEKLREMAPLAKIPEFKDFPKGEMPKVFTTPDGEGKAFVWRSGGGRQIGIAGYPMTKQLGERFGVESGVMINNVREDSPAAKAGLKAGDIIVEVDGKAIKGDIDLIKAINSKKEGDVQLTIVRDRNRQTISVTPEASKDAGFLFQSDDEDGIIPPRPGQFRMTAPAMPAAPTPMTAPAPFTVMRPGRSII